MKSGEWMEQVQSSPAKTQDRFAYTQVTGMCLPVIQTQNYSTKEAAKAAHSISQQYYVHVILDGTKDPPAIITAEVRRW